MKRTLIASLALAGMVSMWGAGKSKDIPEEESGFPTPMGLSEEEESSGFPTPMGLSEEMESTGYESFDEFRKQIYSDFDKFRTTILEHYADFLEGEWHEYEPMEGMTKYSTPKPSAAPSVEGTESVKSSLTDEQRKPRRKVRDLMTVLPDEEMASDLEVSISTRQTDKMGALADSTMRKVTGDREVRTMLKDLRHGLNLAEVMPGDWLSFFQIDMRMPKIDFDIMDDIKDPSLDCAAQWRNLTKEKVADKVIPEIEKLAKKMNLNDYLKYELVAAYINGKFPEKSEFSRTSAMHYILANMGYAIRLGFDMNQNLGFLLLPSQQQLWARPRVYINDHQYYFFVPTRDIDYLDTANFRSWRFLSCGLPLEADMGNKLNFVIDNLTIPESPVEFNISHNGITLKGEVNENLMPIVQHYPQMDTGDYASSTLSADLRKDLVRQLKEQLGDKDKVTAVNSLLSFVQYGFEYMTDQEYHGYEKPYFLEESLYYPINDCEDRSIFLTYFLWNALGVENQMIAYPGHEAAAIHIDSDISNRNHYGYTYKGRNFMISDPTLYGGQIGDCMSVYKSSLPEAIDKYYTKESL